MSVLPVYERTFDEDDRERTTDDQCPECAGSLVPANDETYCRDCSLLAAEYRIDTGPEWSRDQPERKRTGAPRAQGIHDYGLATTFGHWTDGRGNTLSASKRRRLGRWRRHHNQARWGSKANRNLGHAFDDIRRLTSALDLPASARDRAYAICRAGQNADLFVGRSIEAIASASVHAATRCLGLLWTLADVADYARCDRQTIRTAYRALNLELGLRTRPLRPRAFVPRLASALELPARIRKRAYDLAVHAEDAGLGTGCDPVGVAAACLYEAGHDRHVGLTQKRIANVANVTDATLRRRWHALLELDTHDREW
ncbi:transcription initiation factor IIB [Halomicrococcus sp. NG-SE-24]|uniref:transcription initiation factor IIB n=1 Tax=Halomicrococcus sp. NG-SE-24 TaxID=3436928 RepID=UPI003D976699